MFNIKRNILIAFLFTICDFAFGQNDQLNGNIYVITCFVSDGNYYWNQEERNKMISTLNRSLSWIKVQGSKYKSEFEYTVMEFPSQVSLGDLGNHYYDYSSSPVLNMEIINAILKKKKFNSPEDLAKSIGVPNFDPSRVKIFVFIKGSGPYYSITCPHVIGAKCSCNMIEGCVIHEKTTENGPIVDGIIAHEFLHLFGAWDFYSYHMQSKKTEDEIRKIYPTSIMLRIPFSIQESSIDPITSWLIGWTEGKEEYYKYIPNGYIK